MIARRMTIILKLFIFIQLKSENYKFILQGFNLKIKIVILSEITRDMYCEILLFI